MCETLPAKFPLQFGGILFFLSWNFDILPKQNFMTNTSAHTKLKVSASSLFQFYLRNCCGEAFLDKKASRVSSTLTFISNIPEQLHVTHLPPHASTLDTNNLVRFACDRVSMTRPARISLLSTFTLTALTEIDEPFHSIFFLLFFFLIILVC